MKFTRLGKVLFSKLICPPGKSLCCYNPLEEWLINICSYSKSQGSDLICLLHFQVLDIYDIGCYHSDSDEESWFLLFFLFLFPFSLCLCLLLCLRFELSVLKVKKIVFLPHQGLINSQVLHKLQGPMYCARLH